MSPRSVVPLLLSFSATSFATAQTPLLEEVHRLLPRSARIQYTGSRPAAIDVDLDGAIDLVVGGGSWMRNDGTGRFDEPVPIALGPWGLSSIAADDFDADGDQDAIVARPDGTWLVPDLVSGATPPVLLGPGPAHEWSRVCLADIDGDGDRDAVVANGPVQVFRNQGGGTFVLSATSFTPGLFADGVDVGDLDGDGDVDVVAASASTPFQKLLWLNDGTGSFTPAGPSLRATDVVLLDLHADGDLDVVTANGNTGQEIWFVNDGSGAMSWIDPPAAWSNCYAFSLVVADIDADGDQDLFTPGPRGQIWENAGPAGLVATGQRLRWYTEAGAAADFDGDGDVDVYLERFVTQLLLNDGEGRFADRSEDHLSWSPNQASVVADLDGDGAVDLAMARLLAFGDGRGGWRSLQSFPGTGTKAAGDVDGDGDLDLLESAGPTQPGTGHAALYLNDGAAQFTDAGTALGVQVFAHRALLDDLDGDGDLDGVIAPSELLTHVAQEIILLRNDGTGHFQRVPFPASLGSIAADIALTDVDADGDLDLVAANAPATTLPGGAKDVLFRNDGAFAFTLVAGALPQSTSPTGQVVVEDVDGDLDPDLLLAEGWPGRGRLVENTGNGTFVDASFRLDPNLGVACATFADFDGDADRDLLVLDPLSEWRVQVALNDGTGRFAHLPHAIDWAPYQEEMPAYAPPTTDLDGDGDVDVILPSLTGPRIFRNRTRHLAWRTLPRAGHRLELDVSGPPTTPWFVFASRGLAPTPFGTLGLAPPLVRMGQGTFDASGRGRLTWAVVPAAAMVGSSLYWQALVGSPARLTNVETTTILDL